MLFNILLWSAVLFVVIATIKDDESYDSSNDYYEPLDHINYKDDSWYN